MTKINLELDDDLLRMLIAIEELYEKETRIKIPLDEMIKQLIFAHYMIEIEFKKSY